MASTSSRKLATVLAVAVPTLIFVSVAEAGGKRSRNRCVTRCCNVSTRCCDPCCVKTVYTSAPQPGQNVYANNFAEIAFDKVKLSFTPARAVLNFYLSVDGTHVATLTDTSFVYDAGAQTLTVTDTVHPVSSGDGLADITVTVTNSGQSEIRNILYHSKVWYHDHAP